MGRQMADTERNFDADPSGLSGDEAAARLAAEGPNTLPGSERRSTLSILVEVLKEPMFVLLVAGAGIYWLLGDVHEALVLAASVIVVMAITVVQERKSERALEALKDLSSPRALVIRDGERRRIPGAEVVRGDLVLLNEGDRVPADGAVLAGTGLAVDESLLTGESLPVDKGEGDKVFSGTLVVRGQGRALVALTGPRTEFGRIGQSLATLETGKTRLQEETGHFVKVVAIGAIATCVLLTLAYAATRGGWLESVLAGITLAMAVLPEEFPVILTVFLAIGAWRISRHDVLTRRMPAIETLGAATVLCVDKTGTLTQNRMQVVETIAAGDDLRLRDVAALACARDPFDPMERAIVEAAGASGEQLRRDWTLVREYPITPAFLAVCNAWRSPMGEVRVALKGAPEAVIEACGLGAEAAARAMQDVAAASAKGLRLLAVAECDADGAEWPDTPLGWAFRWLGFVALADPLRAEVPEAVEQCHGAGIRVVMITGDYPGTALAIAGQAGLGVGAGALTGAQLDAMDDAGLAQAVKRVNVFARIRPDQKLRLVQAYRAAGEVVAMTGDGVNDAPALKAAHIGVAMGKRGTDVAREAAALVLLEDHFGSIVHTVRLGRRIYENIRNAMRYILAVHVPTAGMSFIPLAFGWPPFLFPVHIVFLEFVIDPACSIVFEAEASEEGAMRHPPRDPRERLFSAEMVGVSLLLGAGVLVTAFLGFWWASRQGWDEGVLRAFGFTSIVFGNLAMIHATRTRDRSIFRALAKPNPALWMVTTGALVALLAAVYLPPMASLFRFAPLPPLPLLLGALSGASGVLFYEAYKVFRPRHG